MVNPRRQCRVVGVVGKFPSFLCGEGWLIIIIIIIISIARLWRSLRGVIMSCDEGCVPYPRQ